MKCKHFFKTYKYKKYFAKLFPYLKHRKLSKHVPHISKIENVKSLQVLFTHFFSHLKKSKIFNTYKYFFIHKNFLVSKKWINSKLKKKCNIFLMFQKLKMFKTYKFNLRNFLTSKKIEYFQYLQILFCS